LQRCAKILHWGQPRQPPKKKKKKKKQAHFQSANHACTYCDVAGHDDHTGQVHSCACAPCCHPQARFHAHGTDCVDEARLARCPDAARRRQVGEEVGVGAAGHVLDAAKAAALLVAARHAHDHRRVHVHRVAGVLRARPARFRPRCARRIAPRAAGKLCPARSRLQRREARGLSREARGLSLRMPASWPAGRACSDPQPSPCNGMPDSLHFLVKQGSATAGASSVGRMSLSMSPEPAHTGDHGCSRPRGRAWTATLTPAPNIICSRPMSHLEPSDTNTSPGLRPTAA